MKTEQKEFDVFVHAGGTGAARFPTKVTRVTPGDTLRDIIGRAGASIPDGGMVFVGECRSALDQEPPPEDVHEASDPDVTVATVGLGKGGHVHVHRCVRVAVTVNYQTKTKQRRFSPATRIETVTEWARRAFHLTDADAKNLVLQVCSSDERPRPTQHLGELVMASSCEVCFDLVPEQKIEG